MLTWFPLSIFGAIVAAIYVVLAVAIVIKERRQPAGDWISLKGMLTYLVTLPISALAEWLGKKPDYRRNLDMAAAIFGCALLIYLFCAALGWLAGLIFSPGVRA